MGNHGFTCLSWLKPRYRMNIFRLFRVCVHFLNINEKVQYRYIRQTRNGKLANLSSTMDLVITIKLFCVYIQRMYNTELVYHSC